jgi:hypothetical protein
LVLTVAGFGIQIATAAGAEPFAVLAAKRTSGKGEQHLLPQNVFEHQAFFMIITDFGVGRGEGAVGGAGIGAEGAEEEIEVAAEGVADGIEAAGAGGFEGTGPVSADADIGDDLFGAAMLAEELGLSADGEGAELGGFGTVVDGGGGDGGVKGKRLAFEIEERDEHGVLLYGDCFYLRAKCEARSGAAEAGVAGEGTLANWGDGTEGRRG